MMIQPRRTDPDEVLHAIFDACDALIVALDVTGRRGEYELREKLKGILIQTFAVAEEREQR